MSQGITSAISIRQPWTWLILHAGKDIENRTWRTGFRGRCLIHAAKGCTRLEWEEAYVFARRIVPELRLPALAELPRGGIVGEMEVTGCVEYHMSRWFCGPYGFVLANPKPLEFQPCPGALGFFNISP